MIETLAARGAFGDRSATRITVVICTRDRASLLRATLDQMTRLILPPGVWWELLVVDNGSTDSTQEVLRYFAGSLPLRQMYEERAGLSHARNRAVSEARGDYLVWTDDDVLVEETWLAAYAAAFAECPECAVFGGPIRPRFEGTPPRWLTASLGRVANAYAMRDLGDRGLPLAAVGDAVPFGANYAVRRAEQKRYEYDPELGRGAETGLLGEEVSLIRAMLRDGACGRWVPGARVWHWIPRERQTMAYLRGYLHAQGRHRAGEVAAPTSRHLFGRPLWLWRHAIEAEARYRVARAFRTPERWMGHFVTAKMAWGQFASPTSPRGRIRTRGWARAG